MDLPLLWPGGSGSPVPLSLECIGGPLDGEVAQWRGHWMVHETNEVLHVYEYCERGHYHHEGAYPARSPKITHDEEVEP